MKNTTSNMIARLTGATFATLVLMGSAFTADAAAYIKLDGVEGECQDKDHKGWSDLASFAQARLPT